MKPHEFATSDHHFGHKAILKHAQRPWKTVEEMNEALIECWNAKVPQTGAIVYYLGDLSWMDRDRTQEILWRLNGTIRFIWGNHDHIISGPLIKEFDWVRPYYESRTETGIKVCMFHYPIQVWRNAHYGSWHLHGHSHGSLTSPDWMRRMDVGVDTHPMYEPWSFEEIQVLMNERGFRAQDHHGKEK